MLTLAKRVIRKVKTAFAPPLTEEQQIDIWRKAGIHIGDKCHIYSDISMGRDCFLLTIGNNVTVSTGVRFLMHDNGICKPTDYQFTDILGRVTIGDNCFIGAGTIVLPGVSIADNCIIGAGSVVTKSLAQSGVYAGNPAKYICSVDAYVEKNRTYMVNLDNMTRAEIADMVRKKPEILCKRGGHLNRCIFCEARIFMAA